MAADLGFEVVWKLQDQLRSMLLRREPDLPLLRWLGLEQTILAGFAL
jgi:hypothetical protein